MGKSIYYWPGIHRVATEFSQVFQKLRSEDDCEITFMNVPFDLVPANGCEDKHTYIINDLSAKKYDVWLGLSYGASLAWYMLNIVPENLRPEHIILVNPFSNRKQLAARKFFQYPMEWDINPEEYTAPPDVSCTLIISEHDTHIPIEFKKGIIDTFTGMQYHIFYLDAEHAFISDAEQGILYSLITSLLR